MISKEEKLSDLREVERERLFSKEARLGWVEPDLAVLSAIVKLDV